MNATQRSRLWRFMRLAIVLGIVFAIVLVICDAPCVPTMVRAYQRGFRAGWSGELSPAERNWAEYRWEYAGWQAGHEVFEAQVRQFMETETRTVHGKAPPPNGTAKRRFSLSVAPSLMPFDSEDTQQDSASSCLSPEFWEF